MKKYKQALLYNLDILTENCIKNTEPKIAVEIIESMILNLIAKKQEAEELIENVENESNESLQDSFGGNITMRQLKGE